MSYLAARRPGAAAMQRVLDGTGDGDEARALVAAEVATAAALERLGPDWSVLHSLPVGPGPATLAHLVIGPQGVFAISSRPARATVVEVVGGTARLSSFGRDDDLAEVRQLAQRVRAALRRRLGPAVALPPVCPLLSLSSAEERLEPSSEVVAVPGLVAHLEARPGCMSAADVTHLATLVGEPSTWEAPPSEWLPPDLQERYADAVGSPPAPTPRAPDDDVVTSAVTSSSPPQLATANGTLRAAAVLVVLLGVLSLPTVGVTSLPALLLGRATTRRHGGWHWLHPLDACLVLVGMVLAALPLVVWAVLLPVLAAS